MRADDLCAMPAPVISEMPLMPITNNVPGSTETDDSAGTVV